MENQETIKNETREQRLYRQSKEGKIFNNLYKMIISRENIILAFKNLKSNQGSKTPGCDGKTIKDLERLEMDEIVNLVRNKLKDYKPNKVKRVYIPKANGDMRPLGIPCIEDRLIQMTILQILEPICEAKFDDRSYGFRPHRNAHQAIGLVQKVVILGENYYCVDVDIKGFFDNVNHTHLMSSIWSIGIRDKKIISIIKKILHSEIENEGIPEKGVPQGGIISPLLANIYLNELDHWIRDQWETFETKTKYSSNHKKFESLRRRKLKEQWYVRYADDFKIFTKDYESAVKIKIAVIEWLKLRLKLEVSEEKTKITNLKKQSTDFLGFNIKVSPNKSENPNTDKMQLSIRISKKSLNRINQEFRRLLKKLPQKPIKLHAQEFNSYVRGVQNYYKIAGLTGKEFSKLQIIFDKKMEKYHSFGYVKPIRKKDIKDISYLKTYNQYNYKTYEIDGLILNPIAGVTGTYIRPVLKDNFNPYEEETKTYPPLIINGPGSGLYYSNRIGKWFQQKGKCYVTGENLIDGNCHHKIPKQYGGTDEYDNLIWISKEIHIQLHKRNKEFANILKGKAQIRYLELLQTIEENIK